MCWRTLPTYSNKMFENTADAGIGQMLKDPAEAWIVRVLENTGDCGIFRVFGDIVNTGSATCVENAADASIVQVFDSKICPRTPGV